jgi:hypothetical protein
MSGGYCVCVGVRTDGVQRLAEASNAYIFKGDLSTGTKNSHPQGSSCFRMYSHQWEKQECLSVAAAMDGKAVFRSLGEQTSAI